MPDILSDKHIKTIAFYLPQYHAIPENDKAWGDGFTEWTNVRKAKPLFDGHYQPRIPLNNNYYNLLDTSVMEEQGKLAQKYGVYGFCYYHYWFKNGKKLLEKPLEAMLQNPNVTIPYCLCWANENWTKKWDGGNKELIAEQDYGTEEDWEKHLQYFLDFFRDPRYITCNGRPVLLIYRPTEIPCVQQMLQYWDRRAKELGFPGVCFVVQNGSAYFNPKFEMGQFSYQVKFEPFFADTLKGKSNWGQKKKVFALLRKLHLLEFVHGRYMKHKGSSSQTSEKKEQVVFDYDVIWENILKENTDKYLLEGACVDWDNTPRTNTGYRVAGATPEKFGHYYSELISKIRKHNEMPVVFVNAWNEWGEGAYLEPDEKYGYSYLEELKKALDKDRG